MSITNRLKFWRTSAAKSIGAAAALAVFAGFLTPSSASAATQDQIDVRMYIDGVTTAKVCVNFRSNDGLADQVAMDPSHYGHETDYQSAGEDSNDYEFIDESGLSLDAYNSDANVGSPDFTLTYIGTGGVDNGIDEIDCDLVFGVSNIKMYQWDQINFKYRAWTENGASADAIHEGSTAFGQDPDDNTSMDYWEEDIYTPQDVSHYDWDNTGSYDGYVGLANANDAIRDERHTAFFCLSNDYYVDNQDGVEWNEFYYKNIEDATVRVFDDTTGEEVTNDAAIEIAHYSDGNFPDNDTWSHDCSGEEQSWLISGLTLGHTYHFQADMQTYSYYYTDYYYWWLFYWYFDYAQSFDEYSWDTYDSYPFTPLDVRQNQTTVYEQDANAGYDGPFVGYSEMYNADGYESDVLRGDSLVECNDWCLSANDTTYTNVDVAAPASALDYFGESGQAYLYSEAYFYVIDDQGAVNRGGDYFHNDDWKSFAEYNGGQYMQSNNYWSSVIGAGNTFGTVSSDWEYKDVTSSSLSEAGQVIGPQQNGDGGHYYNFHGQAFVNLEDVYYDGDYQNSVWQGLSDTYSSYQDNSNTNWDATSVRATSDTSVELSYTTFMSTDQFHSYAALEDGADDANAWVDPADATYYVRLVPNYGHNAVVYSGFNFLDSLNEGNWCYDGGNPWCANWQGNMPGWDNYSGNEDGRPDRFGTIDYVFSNNEAVLASNPEARTFTDLGDLYCSWYLGDYDGYRYGCWNSGVEQFNLTGLQPGTTYSVEVRVQAPVVDGQGDLRAAWNESDTDSDPETGDGGWINLENRRGYYGLATTYLSAAAQNVTRTSADVAVNLQNSHMVDFLDAQQAGYVAVNKCDSGDDEMFGACFDAKSNSNTHAWDDKTCTGECETNWWFDRFDMTQVSRYPVTHTEYVDGALSAIVNLTQLSPDTDYEVVFAMDYWPTGAQNTFWGWFFDGPPLWSVETFQGSNRKPFVNTLDGDYCDSQWSGTSNYGADCYNGAQNNNIFRTGVVSFRTGDADMVDPTLTSIEPANDSPAAAVDSDLALTFSENVARGSVGHMIKVWNADTASVVYTVDVTSAAVSGSGDTWSVSLPDLNYSTNYYVTIDSGSFVDAAGNTYKGLAGANAKFTTESTDEQGPTLESIATVSTWQDGLADIDTTITLNFDENVVKGLGNVEIRKSSNSQVVRTIVPAIYKNIAIDGKKVTITLSGLLDYSTEYFVYVAPEAFSDTNGNLYGGNAGEIFNEDKPASFTTQDRPDFLGTVDISGSDAKGWRTYSVSYGPSAAFFAVKLYFRDRHTGVYRYMATVYLDDKGQGSVKLKFLHLMQFDYIMGKVGNHVSSLSTVMLP